ncbi:MAG TPA: hypothetical protein VFT20_05755 [Candidatus Limnocylindrales bacterium]|nr:hypothetical protein [Candidatus Limnocylindrales bacterium]
MTHDEDRTNWSQKDPAATGREPEADPTEHRGDFAEGTAKTHAKPGVLTGDFAAGQEDSSRVGTVQPRGDFATGQGEKPVDPKAKRGDFARGLEDDDTPAQ